MDDIMIELDNVNKIYKLYKSENDKLIYAILKRKNYKEKIAVKNFSVCIKKGESVAILGKNGAGKSTILKIIAGIIYPTSGTVKVNGKKVTLLSTNVGLESNLTGRENIYLKCNLLGMEDNEIKKIEKNIIDFAEIGEYIDQPMKFYSSGMKARLGFAISIQIIPDIMIIDETLSVGDEEFKNKCINKLNEMIKKYNITLLFVTHSINLVDKFCKRGIVIDNGCSVFDGDVEDAIKFYMKNVKNKNK